VDFGGEGWVFRRGCLVCAVVCRRVFEGREKFCRTRFFGAGCVFAGASFTRLVVVVKPMSRRSYSIFSAAWAAKKQRLKKKAAAGRAGDLGAGVDVGRFPAAFSGAGIDVGGFDWLGVGATVVFRSVAGVGAGVDFLEVGDGDLGVGARCAEAGVAEELLDEADVGSVFKHVGCATVAQ